MSKPKAAAASSVRSASPASFATSSPKPSQKRPHVGAAATWTSTGKGSSSSSLVGGDHMTGADYNGDGLGAVKHSVASSDSMRSHGSPHLTRSQKLDRSSADSDLAATAAASRALESFADLYGSLSRHGTLPLPQPRSLPPGSDEYPTYVAASSVSRADAQASSRSEARGSLGRLNDVGDQRQAVLPPPESGCSAPDSKFGSLDRTAALRHYGYRDRSLERSGEYAHSWRVQRNRSLDRDYPLLAVSSHSLERCAPDDDGGDGRGGGGDEDSASLRYAHSHGSHGSIGSHAGQQSHSLLIVRLQTQLLEVGKELTDRQKELEQNKSQLNSYIASVKTFWSPELKKERASRKEEAAKAARFADQLRQLQNDKQICQVRIQNLEDRLSLAGLKEEASAAAASGSGAAAEAAAKRERDRLDKEVAILRKTIEEMELRIDIQRKTLAARDASVKKLVEMLQSKLAAGGSGGPGAAAGGGAAAATAAGLAVASALDGEPEREELRKEVAALEQRLQQADEVRLETANRASKLQEALDSARAELKEAQASLGKMARDSRHFEDLQALLDQKAARISELESELKGHEVELGRLRSCNQQSSEDRLHLDALHSHEKLLKSKIDNMKAELLSKANEIVMLKNRIEALETQNLDYQQHVDVLKQHVETKAKTLEMQQHEIHDLDTQVKEKAAVIEKKSAQVENLKSEKLRIDSEASELRLQAEVKDKKLAALEKKVSSLEQQLVDGAGELESARASLSALLLQSSSASSAVSSLEEALCDRDRVIDRLKREKDDAVNEHSAELASAEEAAKELKQRTSSLECELSDKQVELLELQGELSQLRADRLKQDSRLHQLEGHNSQAARELDELRSAYDKLVSERALQAENVTRLQLDVEAAQREVARCCEQATNAQTEVERLHDIVKTMETEKHVKDSQVYELTEQLKEVKQRYASARRSQHFDRAPSVVTGGGGEESKPPGAGAEPEAGRATADSSKQPPVGGGHAQLEERVEELEEALRQSVRITAERELVVADLQRHVDRSERQLTQARTEISILRAYDRSDQTRELEEALRDKDEQLRKMASERVRHTEEAYEMKQEAILAAISEKDTHIALLETSKSKTAREEIERLNHEKRKLNDKLKELTRQRMMLVVERSSDNARKLANAEELSQQR